MSIMQINWGLRLKNKATVAALAAALVAFVYQVCGILGVVPPVSQDQVTNLIGIVLTLLAAMGVLVDPTTDGVSDSSRALHYKEPLKSE